MKQKIALLAAVMVATASPAVASSVTVNDSDVSGKEVTITASESNNNRSTTQAQSATIDQSNNQSQAIDQSGDTRAEGGDQRTHGPAVANTNVSPAVAAPVNAAVPVQTGPVEVLTHKENRIDQTQSNTDNSSYEANQSTTTVNRSSGVVVGNGEDNVILLDSSTRRSERVEIVGAGTKRVVGGSDSLVILLDDRAGFRAGVGASSKSLPLTGAEHLAELLSIGLGLLAIGTVLCALGRRGPSALPA